MSLTTVIKGMIDEKLKSLHTAFLAQILIVDGNKAKIQPLGLTKNYGEEAKEQGVLTNIHIANSALYKLTVTETGNNETVCQATPIKKGDVVLCICCDRNIAAALRGENILPPMGYHNKSDCVIVAII